MGGPQPRGAAHEIRRQPWEGFNQHATRLAGAPSSTLTTRGAGVTWLKLSDDFNKDCRRARISDAAFRVHVEMLCFVMDDENGGFVNADDVIATSRATRPMDALQELIRCGFWTELTEDRWQIIHQMSHQPDPETLEERRRKDAERQNRSRRKAAGLDTPPPKSRSLSRRDTTPDNMRDDTPDVQMDDTRDPGRVGTGRVRETQDPNPSSRREGGQHQTTGQGLNGAALPEWPPVRPPGGVDLETGEVWVPPVPRGRCGCPNGVHGVHRAECERAKETTP